MSTSYRQDQDFISDILGGITLETVIDWIKEHVDVAEVYDEEIIRQSARDNSEPEDVFSEYQLVAWAEANGYVKDAE